MSKVKMQIKNRFDNSVIFEGEFESMKDCVLSALQSSINLHSANLYGANLYGADLSRANLYGADLRDADLSRADLYGADLYGADLSRADLRDADLSRADLYGADLYDADLSRANLYGADLYGCKNADMAIAITRILPEGDLIGWKKCESGVMVKLVIPLDARRSNAMGRKCRAEFVRVIEVIGADVGISQHDAITEYRLGDTVKCDKWDDDWTQECSGGIHFFITRLEAESY